MAVLVNSLYLLAFLTVASTQSVLSDFESPIRSQRQHPRNQKAQAQVAHHVKSKKGPKPKKSVQIDAEDGIKDVEIGSTHSHAVQAAHKHPHQQERQHPHRPAPYHTELEDNSDERENDAEENDVELDSPSSRAVRVTKNHQSGAPQKPQHRSTPQRRPRHSEPEDDDAEQENDVEIESPLSHAVQVAKKSHVGAGHSGSSHDYTAHHHHTYTTGTHSGSSHKYDPDTTATYDSYTTGTHSGSSQHHQHSDKHQHTDKHHHKHHHSYTDDAGTGGGGTDDDIAAAAGNDVVAAQHESAASVTSSVRGLEQQLPTLLSKIDKMTAELLGERVNTKGAKSNKEDDLNDGDVAGVAASLHQTSQKQFELPGRVRKLEALVDTIVVKLSALEQEYDGTTSLPSSAHSSHLPVKKRVDALVAKVSTLQTRFTQLERNAVSYIQEIEAAEQVAPDHKATILKLAAAVGESTEDIVAVPASKEDANVKGRVNALEQFAAEARLKLKPLEFHFLELARGAATPFQAIHTATKAIKPVAQGGAHLSAWYGEALATEQQSDDALSSEPAPRIDENGGLFQAYGNEEIPAIPVTSIAARVKTLKDTMAELESRLSQLDGNKGQAKMVIKKLAPLESDMAELFSQVTSAIRKTGAVAAPADVKVKKGASLKEKVEALEELSHNLKTSIHALEEELTDGSTEKPPERFQKATGSLSTRITQLASEAAALKHRVENVSKRVS